MALYLVTGQSGTGKSAVLQSLKERGCAAYGTDENGVAIHRFVSTDQRLIEEDYRHPDAINWVEDVTYTIDSERLDDLLATAREKDVFLCGGAEDMEKYYQYFDHIFALVADAETLKQRIYSRNGNDYGKKPHELNRILERQGAAEAEFRKAGAIIIDAARPIEHVTEKILEMITVE